MISKVTLAKVTFDGAPPPGVINLGIGQPSPDLLPVDLLRTASEDFLKVAQPQELNYGEKQGDVRFRESLADFLSIAYASDATPESLLLTTGNSQALDFACERFTRPGPLPVPRLPHSCCPSCSTRRGPSAVSRTRPVPSGTVHRPPGRAELARCPGSDW